MNPTNNIFNGRNNEEEDASGYWLIGLGLATVTLISIGVAAYCHWKNIWKRRVDQLIEIRIFKFDFF